MFKKCCTCKGIFPITKFSKDRSRPGGRDYRCSECNSKRKNHKAVNGRFSNGKTQARRKGVPWTLTIDEYSELIKRPCHYCNRSLNPTGSGLDRISNNKNFGYTSTNVVPCCAVCNIIKSNHFSHEEMMELSESIRMIFSRRSGA